MLEHDVQQQQLHVTRHCTSHVKEEALLSDIDDEEDNDSIATLYSLDSTDTNVVCTMADELEEMRLEEVHLLEQRLGWTNNNKRSSFQEFIRSAWPRPRGDDTITVRVTAAKHSSDSDDLGVSESQTEVQGVSSKESSEVRKETATMEPEEEEPQSDSSNDRVSSEYKEEEVVGPQGEEYTDHNHISPANDNSDVPEWKEFARDHRLSLFAGCL